jgi:hypothetical protein
MDELKALESLGFTLPTPAYIFGAILFGVIGIAVYRYGNKTSVAPAKWLGIALMFYPYAISDTWLLYVVGTALCAAVFFFSRRGRD